MRHKNKFQIMKNRSLARELVLGKQRKTLRCSRCKNHGILVLLRGHKKNCPFRSCSCSKCKLQGEKQRVLAAQTALQREEPVSRSYCKDQEEIYSTSSRFKEETSTRAENGPSNSSSGTSKHQSHTPNNFSSPLDSAVNRLASENKQTMVGQAFNLYHSTHARTSAADIFSKQSICSSAYAPDNSFSGILNSHVGHSKSAPAQHHFNAPLHQPGMWHAYQQRQQDSVPVNTPCLYSTHFQDGRGGLRFRYLNLLARLFPQFSDIFINSVLEDTNCELLTAAEWLVQLEERRSFMYPAFESLGTVPLPNQNCENFEYMHQRPGYTVQQTDTKQNLKFASQSPHSSLLRYGKEMNNFKMLIDQQFDHQQSYYLPAAPMSGNAAGNGGLFTTSQSTTHRTTVSYNKAPSTAPSSQANFHQIDSGTKAMNGCPVVSSGFPWPNNMHFPKSSNLVVDSCTTSEAGSMNEKAQLQNDGHVVSDLFSSKNREEHDVTAPPDGPSSLSKNTAANGVYQSVSFVDYIIQNDGNCQTSRRVSSNCNAKECEVADQKLTVISQYIEEEEGYMENDDSIDTSTKTVQSDGSKPGRNLSADCTNGGSRKGRVDDLDNQSDVSSFAESETSKMLIIN